jgi:UDP:flavonoid glycosyltransferase YjiC (YdhE family)
MGITQKALAAAVPVVVVPFGRDQLEVARHVVVARAGVRIAPKRLSAQRIRRAVRTARTMRAGAEKVAQGFRAAGGAQRAVDEIEALARAGAIGRERIAVPAAPTLLRVTERLPTASSR